MSQLADLAKPWRDDLIKAPPSGKFGDYVPHYVANQKALAVVGAHSFEIVQTVRGQDGRIEGCIGKLTCEIDGRTVTIAEVGDCEQPGNWKTDGARLKDAASDAYKRCWMRLGMGLHLYVKEEKGERYFLHDLLAANSERDISGGGAPASDIASSAGSDVNADDRTLREGAPPQEPFTVGESTLRLLRSRASTLTAEKVPVADKRKARGLPALVPGMTDEQAHQWDLFLAELESRQEAPFTEPPCEVDA